MSEKETNTHIENLKRRIAGFKDSEGQFGASGSMTYKWRNRLLYSGVALVVIARLIEEWYTVS